MDLAFLILIDNFQPNWYKTVEAKLASHKFSFNALLLIGFGGKNEYTFRQTICNNRLSFQVPFILEYF